MAERTVWGKAGERLPLDVVEARRARLRRSAMHRAEQLAEARRRWEGGQIQPWVITMALDSVGAEGPWVDEALGTAEPAVDEWEAGIRYPTWEQLLALAELTGLLPNWFTAEHTLPDGGGWICQRSGSGRGCRPLTLDAPRVEHFTEAAVARAVAASRSDEARREETP